MLDLQEESQPEQLSKMCETTFFFVVVSKELVEWNCNLENIVMVVLISILMT
jgi:hypothetical protein